MGLKLYGYFRSSAAYRVRIALNLKGIAVEHAFVHLRKDEQHAPEYRLINPYGLVPMLETDDGAHLRQSLAIIEWLEETHAHPSLLPSTPDERARVRAIALSIACDIHPLNNTRVLQYLQRNLGATDETRDGWYRHWCEVGLTALDTQLAGDEATGRYCHGATPTLADVCLVPQLANARRVDIDIARYPTLYRIEQACNALPAFVDAMPANQRDAES